MTYLKKVQNLPLDKNTYIKIKSNPKRNTFTSDISKKESAEFDVYTKVWCVMLNIVISFKS